MDEKTVEICGTCKSFGTLSKQYWVGLYRSEVGEPVGNGKTWCDTCLKEVETLTVYPRHCEVDDCGKGINEGYLIGDISVICSRECEVRDCEKYDNCNCHDMHLPNLDLTLLNEETVENRNFIISLIERADEFGGIEMNTKEWHRLIDTKTGEKNFGGGLDNWFWTEWYFENFGDLDTGETVWTLEGEAIEIA
jgi:hypothetical protein